MERRRWEQQGDKREGKEREKYVCLSSAKNNGGHVFCHVANDRNENVDHSVYLYLESTQPDLKAQQSIKYVANYNL